MTSSAHHVIRVAAVVAALTGCSVHDAPGIEIPEGCEGQRKLALEFTTAEEEGITGVVAAWTPNRPFTLEIDIDMFNANGAIIGMPDFAEEQILQPLRDLNSRFFEMHGYNILDVDGPPDEGSIQIVSLDLTINEGWGYPYCPQNVGTPVLASPPDGAVIYTRHFFDPRVWCHGYNAARYAETIIHEVAHVFGMIHSDDGERGGVPMSERLTFHSRYQDSDQSLTDDDVRNMGCILPYRQFIITDPEEVK